MRLNSIFLAFCFIVSCFVHSNLFAQKFTYQFGNEVQSESLTYLDYFIGKIGGDYYAIRTKGYRTVYLEKYDDKMNLVYSNKLVFKDGGYSSSNLLRVIELQGNVYGLFAGYDSKANRGKYLAVPMNLQQGGFTNKEIILDYFDTPENTRRGSFSGIVNKEHDKLVIYQDIPNDNKGKDRVSIRVFDSKLELIKEIKSTLPYTDKNSGIMDFILAKDMTLYLLTVVDNAAQEIEKVAEQKIQNDAVNKRTPNLAFTVLAFPVNSDNSYKEYFINLKDKNIYEIKLNIDDDNSLIIAGFYADRKDQSAKNNTVSQGSTGIFIHKINAETKELLLESTTPFSQEFLDEINEDKSGPFGQAIRRFVIRGIETKKDGGLIIVAEQSFSQQFMSSSAISHLALISNNESYSMSRCYNHILVMSFDKDWKHHWNRIVPKKQFYQVPFSNISFTNGYSGLGRGIGLPWNLSGGSCSYKVNSGILGFFASFYYITDEEDKIYIIYNDYEKNLETNDLKKIHSISSPQIAMVIMATIDKNSKLIRTPVFSSKEEKVIFYPRTGYSPNDENDRDIVFACKRGKIEKLVKLKLR